jgi:cytochrome c553
MLAGCHSAPSLTPQEAEGKHLYDVRCAHCHEENDLALKKVPPDLHGLFNRKTLPSGIPLTDDAVRHNVLAGRGMMPGFAGRFDDAQMAALLAYLHQYESQRMAMIGCTAAARRAGMRQAIAATRVKAKAEATNSNGLPTLNCCWAAQCTRTLLRIRVRSAPAIKPPPTLARTD